MKKTLREIELEKDVEELKAIIASKLYQISELTKDIRTKDARLKEYEELLYK